jgi:hypothetical protein
MKREDIENAILSSFFFSNDVADNLSDIYQLDESIFTSPFRKRIASRLNDVKDDSYGFEAYIIEEKSLGTKFETEYIDIISQTPMSLKMSKKYHDKLVQDTILEQIL